MVCHLDVDRLQFSKADPVGGTMIYGKTKQNTGQELLIIFTNIIVNNWYEFF